MSLTCRRRSVVSDVPGPYGEDLAGAAEGAAWVLDGATGVTGETYADAPSDAHWYVRRLDDYLRAHVADDAVSLTDHVANAVASARDAFAELAPVGDLDRAAEPSATAALVRWTGDAVEYYVLCDSVLVLCSGGDVDRVVTDRRIAPFERENLDAAAHLRGKGASASEARRRLTPALRTVRRLKNTPEGYPVLSLDPAGAREGLTGRFEAEDPTAYCCTDGFARLVETYDAYPDWAAAVATLERDGLDAAVDRLRDIERDDPATETYPRLKPADDATATRLDWTTT